MKRLIEILKAIDVKAASLTTRELLAVKQAADSEGFMAGMMLAEAVLECRGRGVDTTEALSG